ncbi:MAG TPA: hypothetical protein V6C76_02810 [Drouetiella sp.]
MDDFPSRRDEPGSELMSRTKVLDLNTNLAAAVSYTPFLLVNVIFSVLWLVTEPKSNHYLRRHAIQSLMICGAVAAVGFSTAILTMVLGFIPFVGLLAGALLSLVSLLAVGAYFLLNFYMMYCSYNNKTFHIPLISDYAEQFEQR